MNLANKLANKAPERQHPRQVLPAVARDGEAYCSMSFQKPAAFAFILFFGGGSPTGVFFSGGSRIGGLFSDGGLTGGFFGSFGGSLLGDLTTFFMESILTCSYPFSLDSKGSKSTFYFILLHSSSRLKNPVSGPIVMFVKSFFIVPVQTIGVEFWPALNRLSR